MDVGKETSIEQILKEAAATKPKDMKVLPTPVKRMMRRSRASVGFCSESQEMNSLKSTSMACAAAAGKSHLILHDKPTFSRVVDSFREGSTISCGEEDSRPKKPSAAEKLKQHSQQSHTLKELQKGPSFTEDNDLDNAFVDAEQDSFSVLIQKVKRRRSERLKILKETAKTCTPQKGASSYKNLADLYKEEQGQRDVKDRGRVALRDMQDWNLRNRPSEKKEPVQDLFSVSLKMKGETEAERQRVDTALEMLKEIRQRRLERRRSAQVKPEASPFLRNLRKPSPFRSNYFNTKKLLRSATKASAREEIATKEQESRRMLDFEEEDMEKDEDITTPLVPMEEGDDILRRTSILQPPLSKETPHSVGNAFRNHQRKLKGSPDGKALPEKVKGQSHGASNTGTLSNRNSGNTRTSSVEKQGSTNKKAFNHRSGIFQYGKVSSSVKLAKDRVSSSSKASHSAQQHKPVIKKPQQRRVSRPITALKKRVSIGSSTRRGKGLCSSTKKTLIPKIIITDISADVSSKSETSVDAPMAEKLQGDKKPCQEITDNPGKCDASTSPCLSFMEGGGLLTSVKGDLDDLSSEQERIAKEAEELQCATETRRKRIRDEGLLCKITESSPFQRLQQMLRERQESSQPLQSATAEKTVRFNDSSTVHNLVHHEKHERSISSLKDTPDSFQDNSSDLGEKIISSESDTPSSFQDNSDDTDNVFRTPRLPKRRAQTKNCSSQDSPFTALAGDCERPSLAPLTPQTKQQVWALKGMLKCQLDSLYD